MFSCFSSGVVCVAIDYARLATSLIVGRPRQRQTRKQVNRYLLCRAPILIIPCSERRPRAKLLRHISFLAIWEMFFYMGRMIKFLLTNITQEVDFFSAVTTNSSFQGSWSLWAQCWHIYWRASSGNFLVVVEFAAESASDWKRPSKMREIRNFLATRWASCKDKLCVGFRLCRWMTQWKLSKESGLS